MSLSNSRSTPPPMTLTQLMSQYHAQKQERHREDVSYSSDSSLDIIHPFFGWSLTFSYFRSLYNLVHMDYTYIGPYGSNLEKIGGPVFEQWGEEQCVTVLGGLT